MKKLLTLIVASIAIILTGATPKVTTSYVSKSGSIVFLFVGTDPSITPVTPGYITNVAANPNILVNNIPVTVQGPFWSSVSHASPWVAYQLPLPVRNVDVITWQAGAGWLSTSQGLIGADSGTVQNYVGQLEPGVFGYMGFNDPTKTVKVGFGGPAGNLGRFCLGKNVIHRSGRQVGGNVTASTPDGYPLAFGPAFGGTIWINLWQTDDNNGIDAGAYPCPQGTWTLLADETTPSTPMTVGLRADAGAPGPRQPSNPTMTPGQIVNGVELGKRWTWDVNTPSRPWNLFLSLQIQTASKTAGPNTLRNLRLFEPGNAPVLDPQAYTNDNIVRMASPASWAFPEVVRFMEASSGSDGASSLVTADDLTPAGLFSSFQAAPRAVVDWTVNAPTFRGNRWIHIYAVRKYEFRISPNVYFAQQYLRCVPSEDPFAPFQWNPLASGLDYGWMLSSNVTPRNSSVAVVELITGDSNGNRVPHNLSSGQFISLGRMPPGLPAANATSTGTLGPQNGMVWVTGPSTFIMLWNAGGIAAGTALSWTPTTTVVNSDAVFFVGNGGMAVPPESIANVSNSLGHGAVWVAVNHCMNDDGVKAQASRLFNATQRGTKVYVQFSNELTIPNAQYGWGFYMASVEGLTQIQAITQRTAEVIAIYRQVWGDDSGSIVGLFQNWTIQPQAVTEAFKYAQAKGLVFDGIAYAGYVDMDASPSFSMAAASICANDARSVANPVNGGPGVLMPMAGYLDLYRHWLKYNSFWNGPNSYFAKTRAALAASGYTLSTPRMVMYECGPSAVIPPRVSTQTKIVRAGLSHDASYHPAYYDVPNAFLQMCQQPGPAGSVGVDLACVEALTGGRGWGGSGFNCPDGADNGACSLWAVYAWQGQKAGMGLNNQFWGTDGAAHDMQNESPGARGWMDWILGSYSNKRR